MDGGPANENLVQFGGGLNRSVNQPVSVEYVNSIIRWPQWLTQDRSGTSQCHINIRIYHRFRGYTDHLCDGGHQCGMPASLHRYSLD
ncbi:hypothetical protein CEXT_545751 [Caerostris extrusa]|uniref:Uncharacterized protein n=1 Tax=Caerostris extrusa TaxID=172846 RepID=A0AAV4MI08_CAEEX|nr:hypothetical protein CEXT_545751 [Caerostris extrusa]